MWGIEWYTLVLAYVVGVFTVGIIANFVEQYLDFTKPGFLLVWTNILFWPVAIPLEVALVIVAIVLCFASRLVAAMIYVSKGIFIPLLPHAKHAE